MDIKKFIDMVFSAVRDTLPWYLKTMLTIAYEKVLSIIDMIPQADFSSIANSAELKAVVKSIFNVIASLIKDSPSIANLVKAFGDFAAEYLIDRIWNLFNSEMRPGFDFEAVVSSSNVDEGLALLEQRIQEASE